MSSLHDVPLVSTIAIGLSVAFVCGFIASKLRMSPLVGYLLAGILIGPHSPGFVADIEITEQLSEIGIVLLMFGVGLHFSVQDFIEMRKIATVGALSRIAIITGLGTIIGHWWGWSMAGSVLYGLSLSVASTVVLLRTLEDHHLMQTLTAKISIAWLIVEDIAMVLALVLIPAIAAAKGAAEGAIGLQMSIAVGKALVFAIIMVVAGKRILPWLLTAVSRTGSRELFTLAAFCMAMGIAFGAALLFGVSLALGAFFAGMMIRESDLNHEVADRLLPFQHAFSVLFFVAVGMLFNPAILIENPLGVFITAFIIIAVKAVLTFGILSFFRYSLRVRLKVAAGLSQIGEFSFILIALGASLGLMPEAEKNLILAGALFSIAVSPFFFAAVRRWCDTHGEPAIAEYDTLAHLKEGEVSAVKNLVVLIGFGRTGAYIANLLQGAAADIVIVDSVREKVEQLRGRGLHAIAGDATIPDILSEAQVEAASDILITVPDPFEARRIVDTARRLNPKARIFVRAHNEEEAAYFESQNIDLIVSGTQEVARRMVEALHVPRTA
jgi:monovalent cation:H+ antiporter-2, CPA2 family